MTTYLVTLATVGGDADAWGTILNTALTALDNEFHQKTIDQNFADKTLSAPVLKDYSEEIPATVTITSNAATVDFNNGNHAQITLTANLTTLTISNPPASGTVGMMMLYISQDATGSRTLTWPASVIWAGGTAPTVTTTASRTDIFTLITRDGGTTYAGAVVGQNYSGLGAP